MLFIKKRLYSLKNYYNTYHKGNTHMKYLYSILLLMLISVPAYTQDRQAQLWDVNAQPLRKEFVTNVDRLLYHIQKSALRNAQPIAAKGLPNIYRISPLLYRGGQPTEEGYRTLAQMGIKVVISLRTQAPDEKLLKKLGITSYHIPINPLMFRDSDARKFLDILQNTSGPVYIHCLYGSDRTGVMVALYRMVYDHWSRNAALMEMKDKRFGFHNSFINLVYYVQNVKLQNITPPSRTVYANNLFEHNAGLREFPY